MCATQLLDKRTELGAGSSGSKHPLSAHPVGGRLQFGRAPYSEGRRVTYSEERSRQYSLTAQSLHAVALPQLVL